nr:hypothetical protein CFP56_05334 [Quercus suber]
MGRGAWVTDPGFVYVMDFGCYNGSAVTCGGGGCGGLWLQQCWLWQVERCYTLRVIVIPYTPQCFSYLNGIEGSI